MIVMTEIFTDNGNDMLVFNTTVIIHENVHENIKEPQLPRLRTALRPRC